MPAIARVLGRSPRRNAMRVTKSGEVARSTADLAEVVYWRPNIQRAWSRPLKTPSAMHQRKSRRLNRVTD